MDSTAAAPRYLQHPLAFVARDNMLSPHVQEHRNTRWRRDGYWLGVVFPMGGAHPEVGVPCRIVARSMPRIWRLRPLHAPCRYCAGTPGQQILR